MGWKGDGAAGAGRGRVRYGKTSGREREGEREGEGRGPTFMSLSMYTRAMMMHSLSSWLWEREGGRGGWVGVGGESVDFRSDYSAFFLRIHLLRPRRRVA